MPESCRPRWAPNPSTTCGAPMKVVPENQTAVGALRLHELRERPLFDPPSVSGQTARWSLERSDRTASAAARRASSNPPGIKGDGNQALVFYGCTARWSSGARTWSRTPGERAMHWRGSPPTILPSRPSVPPRPALPGCRSPRCGSPRRFREMSLQDRLSEKGEADRKSQRNWSNFSHRQFTDFGDTPGTQMFLCCRCKLGDRNPLGSPTKAAGRYSHPRSPNAERSTPGGAYHPPVR